MQKAMALAHLQPSPVSVRRRVSLCPPVGPMARPAMKRRGPGRSPWATPSRMPQSAPPVSRTVVKPRSSIARMAAAPPAVIKGSGIASRARMFTSEMYTWAWQSIRPGMSVRPPTSNTAARGAAIGRDDTSRIVSPSTSTEVPGWSSSRVGSSRAAFSNRIWPTTGPPSSAQELGVVRVRAEELGAGGGDEDLVFELDAERGVLFPRVALQAEDHVLLDLPARQDPARAPVVVGIRDPRPLVLQPRLVDHARIAPGAVGGGQPGGPLGELREGQTRADQLEHAGDAVEGHPVGFLLLGRGVVAAEERAG